MTRSNTAVKAAPSGRWTLRDKAPRSAQASRRFLAAMAIASSAYGQKGPSATVTVDNATSVGLHLSPWKFCPNKRGQLCAPSMGAM